MAKRAPRLLFTEEELETQALKKPIKSAEKAQKKLEKAERKVPKKKIVQKQRVYDPKENSTVTRLVFEETEKKRPSALSHAVKESPLDALSLTAHKVMHDNAEDSSGTELAHDVIGSAEGSVHTLDTAHRKLQDRPYSRALKAERAADRASLEALYRQAELKEGGSVNPYSRFQQRRAIKKAYAQAKAGGNAAGAVKASEVTAAAAAERAKKATEKISQFFVRHRKGLIVVGAAAALILLCGSMISSCSMMMSSFSAPTSLSTYPSEDADMLAAEARYLAMEQELQEYLDTYEAAHDYDEYHFDLDEIEHDPYVLISMITALKSGAWTVDEIGGILSDLFERQYILTETVETETRYRTETVTGERIARDPDTGEILYDEYGYPIWEEYEYEDEVPYDYYICTVTLENYNLSHIPILIMGQDTLSLYAVYMSTLGNRPDLFGDSAYVGLYYGSEYPTYEIPAEALADEQFAAMIKEAEKYLGYPYVWGGSSPSTSFDCSGYVSWVINHCGVGWNVGRLGAEGLRGICSYVSPANAKPGDLIFFEKTYDTTGASHVGIYVGNQMMVHCGDPIRYVSIDTSYWQQHFLQFGRLPRP